MISLEDITNRIARLDELMLGLAREVYLWQEANDPLLYRGRKAYLDAVRDAIAGVESARIVLVQARHRMTR